MRTSAVIRTFIVVAGLGLIATGVAPSTAYAQTTAPLSVSTSVANKCLISTNSVAFAAYDPVVAHATANDDGTGSVTVRCTKGATASVALGDGGNGSRIMKAGSVELDYELYANEGRSAVWTSVNLGQSLSANTPLVATVYGRIPAGQDVASGTYSDTVVATVNF